MSLALRAILLVLLALFPAAMVQVHQASEARDARRAALEQQALRLALLVAGEQDRIFEGARQLLNAMAAHESVRAAARDESCNAYMRRVLEAFPRYVAAQSVDLRGRSLCAPRPELFHADLSDRAWFREAVRADGFALGDVVVGRGSGVSTLHAAMPFRDGAGRAAGVLVVGLSLDWLNAELARVPLPEGATLLVVDRAGVVVARAPDPGGFVGRPVPNLRRDLLEAARPGVVEMTALDGARRVLGYVPVRAEPVGLYVGAALDATAGETAATEAAWRNAGLILVSLLVGFGLLLAGFQGAVTRPVEGLLAAAARWRAGDWGARAEGGARSGEFRRLAAAFNTMAETVEDRERARGESERRFRALVEVSPQIVFSADAEGRVTWLNHHWEKVTGLPRDASLGGGWAAALHPDDLPAMRAAWEEAVARSAAGVPTTFEREFRLRDGRGGWRWHLGKAEPAMERGRVAAWTGVASDVDALKRAEAEAEDAAARLAATYATAPVGLALFDADLRFLSVNDAMAALNRRPKEAHLGRTLGEAAPHVAVLLEPLLRRVLRTGEPVDGHELTLPGKGGVAEEARLCSYHPVRDAEGRVVGVSASVVDITARRRAEQTERLLMREVDHRARNALAVVRSLVRLSAAEAGDDPAALVATLEGRISAMTRAHTLLSNSRWSGGDLGQLAREELAAHGSAATAEGPPTTLTAEAVQPMAMALHELVTNAAKHGALSRPGGRVAVRWAAAAGGGLALEWAESGGPELPGEPARLGFGTRLIEANATGLLDGSVEWRWGRGGLRCLLRVGPDALVAPVELGDGAAPAAAGDPPARPPPVVAASPAAPPLAGARVLLVEDEVLVALEAARTLEAAGCSVAGPAYSVEEGLALARSERVDAAVLDLNLRGRPSAPILEELRARGVPCLIASGYGEAPEGHGDVPVLEKPVPAATLLAALAGALGAARREAAE